MFDSTLRIITHDQESITLPAAPVTPLQTPNTEVAAKGNVIPLFAQKNNADKKRHRANSKFRYPMLECK